MSVNERLVGCGLLDAWNDAARDRNRAQMVAILLQADIEREQAERTTDAGLKNPEMYGF